MTRYWTVPSWRPKSSPPQSEPEKDYSSALAEARRRLDDQLTVVVASRGRITGMLGVGGLVGTFVGGLGGREEARIPDALWVAAGAFSVAVIVGLLVLAPWKFHAALRATDLVGWVDGGQPRSIVERDLALRTDGQVDKNARKAGALQWGLLIVTLALAIEFVALALEVVRSR